MELTEFQYLINNGYITDVTYVNTIMENYNTGDKSLLKNLSESDLVDKNIISQSQYIAKMHTFTVNVTPEDAKITLKYGDKVLEQKQVIVEHGTSLTWSAEKEGYTKQEETVIVNADEVKNVELEEITLEPEMVTITFNITPEEATLTIDGEPCPEKSKTVELGSELNYTVTTEGYNDVTASVTADSTKTETINMTKKQYNFTITATPEGATVTIGGEQVTTKKVDHGSNVEWSVTMEGYTTQSGTESNITADVSKNINLEAISEEASVMTTSTKAKAK